MAGDPHLRVFVGKYIFFHSSLCTRCDDTLEANYGQHSIYGMHSLGGNVKGREGKKLQEKMLRV